MEDKYLEGVYIGIPNTDISPMMFTNRKNLKNPNGFGVGVLGSGKGFRITEVKGDMLQRILEDNKMVK